ncbi:hypothetical protein M9458_000532, partial [Cirrhinus mrigala]
MARSSSILGTSDLTLLRITEGSGGLLACQWRHSQTPPCLPLLCRSRVPVCGARIAAG